WSISSLLKFGTETLENTKKEGGKKPVYDESQLRDLADAFGQIILNGTSMANTGAVANGAQYADQIEKYAPSRAIQIRAKFGSRSTASNSRYGGNTVSTVPNSMANSVNSASVAANQKRASAEAAEAKLMDDLQK